MMTITTSSSKSVNPDERLESMEGMGFIFEGEHLKLAGHAQSAVCAASLSRPYDIVVTKPPLHTTHKQRNRIATLQAHSGATTMHAPRHFHLPCAIAPLCLALLLCTAASAARADVYAFVAEDGSSHFSDSPNDPRYALLLRVASDAPAAPVHTAVPMPANKSFEREIAAAARSSQVEAALLHAVIAVESNYNPRAVSRKGALGMMQLMPATARAMGVADPLNASQNIRGGAQYLRTLLDRFANDKALALAAYNAGAGAVLASGGRIPAFAETRSYVPAVLKRYAYNLEQAAQASN
jgi:hypothetical protein